jgi:hypothetical protein
MFSVKKVFCFPGTISINYIFSSNNSSMIIKSFFHSCRLILKCIEAGTDYMPGLILKLFHFGNYLLKLVDYSAKFNYGN